MNNTWTTKRSIMKLTALWREKRGECAACLKIQYVYLLNKYIKCSVWRLAVRYVIYIYNVSRLRVNSNSGKDSSSPMLKIPALWNVTVCRLGNDYQWWEDTVEGSKFGEFWYSLFNKNHLVWNLLSTDL